MHRQSVVATYVAISFVTLGFIAIALAWNGAASLDYVQGQLPYVLSGGLFGLALIAIGTVVLILQTLREDASARAAEFAHLQRTVATLTALLSPPDEYDPGVAGEFRPRPRAASNGSAPEPLPADVGFEQPA